ncbi:uncharacterized protein LOC100213957 isoform X1 [Hydra vulgaris]|uniref:uncharacterized protein LOC100213957 isoform X1 n=2 Tax=Hydra vulgaris TaxID=6087 RepID=UPI001F5F29DD|nr:uncharacterized protein LOC100213957 isoform X1 [Hydra vulgaris]
MVKKLFDGIIFFLLTLVSSDMLDNFKHSLDMSGLELINSIYNTEGSDKNSQPIINSFGVQNHSRKRRSNLNFDTIKLAQQSGNREELLVKTLTPYSEIPFMSEPSDIVPILIKAEDETFATEIPMLFAVANYRNLNGSFLSNVIIWSYNNTSNEFVIHQVLEEYAPYEVEFFKGKIAPLQCKYFLAVAGYVEDNNGTHPTKVSVYEIGPSPAFTFIKIQEFPNHNIRALKHVTILETTYLMLGSYFINTPNGKQYYSPSQVIVHRYDPNMNMFYFHSSLPGSGVVDLESYSYNLKTFIIVTNYRDNIGNLDIFSFIYIYNDRTKLFDILQYLPTHGAQDMNHFLLSGEAYLVVANEAKGTVYNKSFGVYSDIYKYINGKYYLIQSVATYGAKKWVSLSVPNCMKDILLFYADQRNNVDQVGLYTFSHTKESFKIAPFSIYQLNDVGAAFRPNPLSLATFSQRQFGTEASDLFLMVGANNTMKESVYKLTYEVFFTDSPLDSFTREVEAKLIQLNKTLEEVKMMLYTAQTVLNDAVKENDSDVITGSKTFFNKVFINKANISKLEVTNGSIAHVFENETLNETLFSIEKLYSNFSQQNLIVHNIFEYKDLFMTLDEQQNITANMTFNELSVDIMNIEKNAQLDTVNEIDISFLFNDLVSYLEPTTISGEKTFMCEVAATDIQVGFLNGLIIKDDLVVNNTNQTISAPKIFKQTTILKNNMIAGLINSFNVTKEVMLTDQSGVILGENLFIAPICADNIIFNNFVNNLNISNVFSNLFTKSTEQIINGFKDFSSIFSNSSVNVTLKLNNYDLLELKKAIGFKENVNYFYGNKVFNSTVTILEDIDVEKFINEIDPTNYVNVLNDQNITGMKTFEGHIIANKDLIVSGKVDGMYLTDLITLDGNQEILGSKMFLDSLEIVGNYDVKENFTINDIDISEVIHTAVSINNSDSIEEMFFEEIEIYNSTIQGMVNYDNYSTFQQLYSDVLHFDGDQVVTGKIQIDLLNVTSNFNTTFLNGFHFPNDFVQVNKEQTFQGYFMFEDDVIFNENIKLEGKINEIDIQSLEDTVITLHRNEVIAGVKRFGQYIHIGGDIIVDGMINDIDLSKDVMTLSGDQEVSAQKLFTSISYESLLITVKDDLAVSTTIDGVDLSHLNSEGMMISRNQTITGSICFQQPDYNKSTHYVNNIDLHLLHEDIVTLNTNQTITSKKVFEIIELKKNLLTTSTIDQVDISELKANTILLNETVTVDGDFEISDLKVEKDVLVTKNLLIGENVITLNDLVSKYGNYHFEMLIVEGNIQGVYFNLSNVNGLNINKDIVYKTKEQTIDGFKNILSASFDKIIVNGTINDVNFEKLLDQAVFKNRNQILKGNKLFSEDLYGTNINSTFVNGFDINNLGLVRTEGLDYQEIKGLKTFYNLTWLHNLTMATTINGVDFKEFSQNLVQTNKDQTVVGDTVFQNGFSVLSNIHVSNHSIVNGLINGVNISNLNETTLKTNGNQVIGSKTFTGTLTVNDLTVFEKVNGINLPDDLLTKSTEQTVLGQKTFLSSLKTVNDVTVEKLINNVNTSDLFSSSLLINSNQVQKVGGEKTFSNNIFMQNILSIGKVDGHIINNNSFVTLHTEQEIIGQKTFTGNLVSENIQVKGKIADVSWEEFYKSCATVNNNQTIRSDIIFINDVYINSNTIVSGLVNEIDLLNFVNESPALQENLLNLQNQLNVTLNTQCSSLTYAKAALEGGAGQHDYFTLQQNLPHKKVQHVEYFVIQNEEFLAVSVPSDDFGYQCAYSYIMKYNYSSKSFYDYQIIPTAGAIKMIFFTAWNSSFLFVVNYDENCPNISGPSQLYKWNMTSLSFEIESTIATTGASDAFLQYQKNLVYIFISNIKGGLQLLLLNSSQTIFYEINNLPSRAIHGFISPIGYSVAFAVRSDNISSYGWVNIALVTETNVSLYQQLSSRGISCITSFWNRNILYLVVANDQEYTIGRKSTFRVSVDIYAWYPATTKFVWFQTIPTIRAVDTSIYQLGSVTYLLIVQFDQSVSLYKFSYEFGFQQMYAFSLNGVRGATTFKNLIGSQYVILASIYTSSNSDSIETPVLLSKINGVDRTIAQKSSTQCEV